MAKTPKEERGLITFIRVPELGKVKTRLASAVGDQKALDIYCQLLEHTKKVCLSVSATTYLYYATSPVEDDWSPSFFIKKSQKGDGLGDRMSNAFEESLKENDKVVIIGSDCPQLSTQIIQDAYEKLEYCDVVIGPTYDGGYYLLGMSFFYPELFRGIEWSTDSVFTQTLNIIENLGLTHSVLETLSDIDYKEDWEKHGWEF